MTQPNLQQLEQELAEAKKRVLAARRAAAAKTVGEYTFTEASGAKVSLASLFGDKKDLLLVHNMGKKCPYCTLWADGFIGVAKHLENRCGFALTSPDDHATMAEFARSRHWPYRVLSHKGTTFAKDMGYEPEPGKFWPGVSAFAKNADGSIVRTGTAPFGPGDDFCSVWPMLDLLKDGAADWKPKYQY